MTEAQIIEKIARDLCDKECICVHCNASVGFECTARKTAKRLYDLGYRPPENSAKIR